jgi:hypothetical protein
MIAMKIVGLSMVATMAQAQQAHTLVGDFIGITIFGERVNDQHIQRMDNLRSFSYVILTLIVRSSFIHPVHRRISVRGSKSLVLCSSSLSPLC